MTGPTVSDRLIAFVRHWRERGLPADVLHEANRLLINQLKASVGAAEHPAVVILRDWALASAPVGGATILWLGHRTGPEQACMVNAALFEVLDFNETYIPTFQHAVSGVLPALMAQAELGWHRGRDFLTALALGIEVELACAAILMPSGYYRGFVPGGITGAIGGALACGLLAELDDTQLRNALGLAMNSGAGFYQSAGSQALSYVMGMAARNGLNAAALAGRGLDAPALSFEGDKAMLSAYSDEPAEKIDAVLSQLGRPWRVMGQSYKTIPTETITHGPVECVFALRARAAGRKVARMRFGVAAIVVKIADERAARFGSPSSDLEAKFDLRHCAAAAWLRGRFTLAEMRDTAYEDPAILALRERIELVADPTHQTFEGASLDILYEDGGSDRVIVPHFRGTPRNPLDDAELSAVFRLAAQDVLAADQIERILDAAWSLPSADGIAPLMSLLTLR